jgi:hypothetical protein
MMRRLAPISFVAVALAGCPGDDDGVNDPVLWLSLDRVETRVRLSGEEPPPF